MPEIRQTIFAPLLRAARRGSIRDGVLLGLALSALAVSGETMAAEQATISVPKLDPAIASFVPASPAAGPIIPAPGDFTLPTENGIPVYSTTEFRPRRHTVLDADPNVSAFSDTSMIHSTTVWQRLSQYKSHDRVQLLTLWQTSGSSVSLQAGKHGDPSLQWTSRIMNRGGSTQGLLDKLFSVSIAGAANGLRSVTHSNSTPPASKVAAASTQSVAAAKK